MRSFAVQIICDNFQCCFTCRNLQTIFLFIFLRDIAGSFAVQIISVNFFRPLAVTSNLVLHSCLFFLCNFSVRQSILVNVSKHRAAATETGVNSNTANLTSPGNPVSEMCRSDISGPERVCFSNILNSPFSFRFCPGPEECITLLDTSLTRVLPVPGTRQEPAILKKEGEVKTFSLFCLFPTVPRSPIKSHTLVFKLWNFLPAIKARLKRIMCTESVILK